MARQRVLVVEDDPAVLRTVVIALSRAGYSVLEARDGDEAMRLWRDGPADLVITDLHMPQRNGFELIMELRGLSPATPIVAITDGGRTGQMELLRDAKLLGAVRTLAKPFRLEAILATVDEELRRIK